jgi:iron complex transport system substrate-binding protein
MPSQHTSLELQVMTDLRIVSLIPSATEIVDVLGLTSALVGRSHECDYPASVKRLPICTQPKFDPVGTSGEIHDRVTDLLQSALSVYRIETDVLQTLQPTHILTQAQCEVCAVSLAEVEAAIAQLTGSQPQIISLQPTTLAEVWHDIERVGTALNVDSQAAIAQLKHRVEAIATQAVPTARPTSRPTVACIEWADPLMAAGNWIPELVQLAGGQMPNEAFGQVGKHSPWLTWEALLQADPDYIVLLPCGYDLDRTRQDAQQLAQHPNWSDLKAVQQGQVFITDGNQYFNRPGPRLVDSLEIMSEILHPEIENFRYKGEGWQLFRSQIS